MRIKKVTAGEWTQPIERGYRMRCNGVIYHMDFRTHRGKTQMRVFLTRKEWKTGQGKNNLTHSKNFHNFPHSDVNAKTQAQTIVEL